MIYYCTVLTKKSWK